MHRIAMAVAALALTAGVARADWNAQAFRGEQTLEFLTIENGEEHWSTVWLVVLEGQIYLRLGDRAASRIEGNATKPFVQIRIAGQTFPKVQAVPAPEMAGPVAAAMADKYWSDLFVRFFPHPLTLRLIPAAP